MAKKISSKDLFEQEDIFLGIRESAEKTLLSLEKINAQFKESATVIKSSLGNAKFNNSDDLKKFAQATAEANKVQKQAIEIEKLKQQVEQQAIKSEQERERLAQQRIRTEQQIAKAAEKSTQTKAKELSEYQKLSKSLTELKNRYKDLAVTEQQNTQEGQELLLQITELDNKLKQVDATVGNHQRNVGNYKEATTNLKLELRQLTMALMQMDDSDPRFQEMTQRAGELTDQIADTKSVIKATAGSAVENLAGAMATTGQIGIAAFQGIESSMVLMGVESEAVLQSMQKLQALAGLADAIQVLGGIGDKLREVSAGFTAFGSKAIQAFKGMSTASKAFIATGIGLLITAIAMAVAHWDDLKSAMGGATAAQKINNEVTKQAYSSIQNEISAVDKLQKQLNSENLTREEKIKKVKEFQAQYPGLLQNQNLEAMSIDQINTQLTKNIELLKLQAQAKAIQAVRAQKLQDKLEMQLRIQKDSQEVVTGLNGALGGWSVDFGETAANGFIGFSTGAENAAKANQNLTTIVSGGTTEIDKQVDALDKSSDAIDAQIAALQKNGAQNSGIITDYSKMAAGTTHHTNTLNTNTEALERQRKELERLNNIAKLRSDALDEIQQAESEYQDSLLSQQQREINEVRDKYFILIENAKTYGHDSKILEEALQKALTDIDKKYADEQIKIAKDRQNAILDQEEEFMDQYQTAINTDKQNEINSVREKYFYLIEMAKQRGLDTKVLEEKLRKELADIDTKYNKDAIDAEKKAAEERKKLVEAVVQKTADFFKKKSEERMKAMDEEIKKAEEQASRLRTLADNGNINARESLAEQEKIIAESNRRKQKEMRRQQRIEQGMALFKAYSANVDKGSKNPLADTIRDATALTAFVNALPAFEKGTEDTGKNGFGVDGKGGMLSILHPNERVLPKTMNDRIGDMSNEQLTRIAQEYQNGRLIANGQGNEAMEFALLLNEIKDLKSVIKDKPTSNIELGRITQSAIEIVESKHNGNSVVYNRFKVRK